MLVIRGRGGFDSRLKDWIVSQLKDEYWNNRLTALCPTQVVIVQPQDTGSKAHPFPYAIVAGIERYPLKVTRRMGKKLVDRRSRIKPFIKVVNYNHLMPTRYTLELEGLKGVVSQDTFKEVSQREEAKKTVKKALEDRYTSGKNRWFFTPLRMHTSPTIYGFVLMYCCRFLNGLSGVLSF